MTLERAHNLTVRRIILPDMVLNWFLGAVLLFVPRTVDSLLGTASLLPAIAYQGMGVLFLVFAAWQLTVVRRGAATPAGLVFAALMAEVPVLALTAALVFGNFPLLGVWRVVLWIGDIYMLFLGTWYLALARWLAKNTGIAA